MRVLLVEDDPELASVLEDGLTEENFQIVRESTVDGARSRATLGAFDVIVLDVMLPGGNGFDLCRELRERGVGTPVLMLTPRATPSTTPRARARLEASMIISRRPFAFRELVARVRALARRRPTPLPEIVQVGDLEVDLLGHRVKRGGKSVELTAKEFALLEFFVRHVGQVVDRAAITAHVWDENHDPFTNVLEVLVRRLRRKIDDGFDVKLHSHVPWRAGYRLGT